MAQLRNSPLAPQVTGGNAIPLSSVRIRGRIRLRESHVRDHLAPLLSSSAHGVVKLDLVLRGVAALPGENDHVGLVPPWITWECMHDLAREGEFYREDTVLARKWVSDKLSRLEDLGLVRRQKVAGRRSRLIVLRDDGSGELFDDPSGKGSDSYVTVLGTIITFRRLNRWRSPQLSAYLAAMIAERYARADPQFAEALHLHEKPLGGGSWYRPLSWFADEASHRPDDHVRVPFSQRTLRRGIRELEREGLIRTESITHDPRTGKRFDTVRRVLYHNGFDDVRWGHHRRRNVYWSSQSTRDL